MASKDEPLCLTPECGKPAKWKGLCSSCYGAAKTLINNEETTWDELARMGLAVIPALVFYNAFKQRKNNAEVQQHEKGQQQEAGQAAAKEVREACREEVAVKDSTSEVRKLRKEVFHYDERVAEDRTSEDFAEED